MNTELNYPYVKQHDENGKVINPISDIYPTVGKTRRQRRAHKNLPRFMGNGKNFPIVSAGDGKYLYKKVVQVAFDKKTGEKKVIYHYLIH